MDNLSSHKKAAVRRAIEEAGATLTFLPLFQDVRRAAGILCPAGEPRPPRPHDLRHTAAYSDGQAGVRDKFASDKGHLRTRGVGLKVLTGAGAQIDTTTANGRVAFGIFAAFAEFERELIAERTIARLAAARARGRMGGRPRKMDRATLMMAMSAMTDRKAVAAEVAKRIASEPPLIARRAGYDCAPLHLPGNTHSAAPFNPQTGP